MESNLLLFMSSLHGIVESLDRGPWINGNRNPSPAVVDGGSRSFIEGPSPLPPRDTRPAVDSRRHRECPRGRSGGCLRGRCREA